MRQVTINLEDGAFQIFETIARGKRSKYISELIVNTWTTPRQRIISELNALVDKARDQGIDVAWKIEEASL